jgi:hypothetical protein
MNTETAGRGKAELCIIRFFGLPPGTSKCGAA